MTLKQELQQFDTYYSKHKTITIDTDSSMPGSILSKMKYIYTNHFFISGLMEVPTKAINLILKYAEKDIGTKIAVNYAKAATGDMITAAKLFFLVGDYTTRKKKMRETHYQMEYIPTFGIKVIIEKPSSKYIDNAYSKALDEKMRGSEDWSRHLYYYDKWYNSFRKETFDELCKNISSIAENKHLIKFDIDKDKTNKEIEQFDKNNFNWTEKKIIEIPWSLFHVYENNGAWLSKYNKEHNKEHNKDLGERQVINKWNNKWNDIVAILYNKKVKELKTSELNALGFTSHDLTNFVKHGTLNRERRGVYSVNKQS